MFAIGFDLLLNQTRVSHPKGVFQAYAEIGVLPWFPTCVRDVRAFKVEHWSDFTDFMKT